MNYIVKRRLQRLGIVLGIIFVLLGIPSILAATVGTFGMSFKDFVATCAMTIIFCSLIISLIVGIIAWIWEG